MLQFELHLIVSRALDAAQFPVARAGINEISDLLLGMLVRSLHRIVLLSECARPPGQTSPTRSASVLTVWPPRAGDDSTCAWGHHAIPRGSPQCSRGVASDPGGDRCCPHSPDPTPVGPVVAPSRSQNRAVSQSSRAGTYPECL